MRRFTLPFLALLLSAGALRAEEGMWTFDNVPRKLLKERYGFEPTQAWLDHLRLSSLHWGGASGSFVSPDGLVLTNHHVARGSIGRISTKERDLVKTGYVARTRDEELKIPGLTVRTLVEMVIVTAQVNEAVKPGMKEARALEAALEARLGHAVPVYAGNDCVAVTLPGEVDPLEVLAAVPARQAATQEDA